ncbi:hypothetical protein HOY82DRAFT_584417 [Tuber indicum]|nr:hypothetical protein HOY82DRAFT_584417 [Tuber indicum]
MQAKVFLTSLLVAVLTTSVVASPAGLEARDSNGLDSANDAVTALDSVTSFESGGETQPLPQGTVLTPGQNDVPVAAAGLEARDLENFEKRTPGCLSATIHSDFLGAKVYVCLRAKGGCYNWNSYWRSNISSFRPDLGTTCRIYTGAGCTGVYSVTFGYPGYGRLGRWNDNMGSFRCWW